MPVNPSNFLRYLKRKLGATHMVLPLSDDEIMETVIEESLPMFSKYYPYMLPVLIDSKKSRVAEGIYKLETNGLEIMGVQKYFPNEGYMNGDIYPRIYTNNIYEMQMIADMKSMVSTPETFMFLPPDKVEVYPKYRSNFQMMFVCKCVHPSNLSTIPLNLKDQFYMLAEYDVKISLYQILKNFNDLETPYGTISLKLEDLEQANDLRRELLESWDTNFLREPNRIRIWVE